MAQRKWMGVLAFVAAAGFVSFGGVGASLAQPARVAPKDKDKEKDKSAPRRGGGPVLGDAAPEWAVKDADGKEHKLSEYKGKVVVMDFWATWCSPCKKAMPGLQKLHEEFKDQDVVVIGMNMGERPGADPAGYMKSQNLDYLLLLNADQVARDYGVQGIPAFYVVDKDGKVILREVGFSPASEKKLHDTVSKAVGGEKSKGKNPDKKKPEKEGDQKPQKPADEAPGTGTNPKKPGGG